MTTPIRFTNLPNGGITAQKLNKAFQLATGGGGTGDMTKAVYDTNGDGISDHAALADSAPWSGITGKPATFPPDSTAMLKSVYDTNGDGVSDHAALADAAPWTGITGKPSTFPPDSTAMLKSVYDTNNDGISDHAALSDAVPWTGVSGKPATFPPDSTAMLKSVYDTNANNKVDAAESADSVPWTGIVGKPASFVPSAHSTTHLDNGSDPVPVVTIARTGLVPVLPNDSSKFLNGAGSWTVAAGGSGNTFEYRWSTVTTAADPGTGYARANNVNPLSATSIYISVYDRSGSLAVPLARLAIGDTFYLYETGNASQYVVYQLSSIAINHSTWYELPVTVTTPNGFSPVANASIQVALPAKPAAHATTHITGGTDVIPAPTTSASGLVPMLPAASGTAKFLDGTGVFNQVAYANVTGTPAIPAASGTTPIMDGTGAVGLGTAYARNDHVHPSDTSRAVVTRLVSTAQSLAGGGDLSADRTLTLVGDSAAPGNSMFYGTNPSGTRGWYAQATGTVNPGTWTNLTYGTGWTQNTTAQFRVEVNGTFSNVICQGIINYASGAASLAFTLPAGARPGVTRGCVLAGFDSSGDVLLFSANVSVAGAVTILPMVRQSFVWPSATNGSVYLDNLTFAL